MHNKFARSVTPRAAGVLILVVVAAVLAGRFQTAHAASPSIPVTHAGYVPVLHNHQAQPQDNCPPSGCGGGKLVNHGGPTMTTNKTYSIFWVPSGQTVSANYVSTINQYFQDVAHDSGMSTNVYASDTQYSSILYSSTYGGTFTDSAAFPANGCSPYGGASVCLSDSQLQSEINKVITAQGWAKNGTNMFFVFTPKNVESCDGGNGCAFTSYCAYHGVTGSGAIYANMPYGVNTFYPGNCDVGEYPNGNDADATLNVTSHEHNEAITDDQLNAWYDSQGYENGDKCAWTFGTLSGPSGGQYNQTINGHHYFLQEEFSNSSGSNGLCVQTYQIQGGGNPPTVTSFSPTSGSVGTQVDVQGTNFTGATSVTFNGTADTSFQVNSSTDITAHVPSGASTGPIAVTTGSGSGASTTNFTVTGGGGNPPTVTSFTPTSGPVGTNVSITGSGFTGATTVKFNGTAASFTFNSDTSISAHVPSGATTGPIAVTTGNGTGTSSSNFTVTSAPPPKPSISSFTPTSGHRGISVTINGSNFTGATSVKLGFIAASFTVNSNTKITATVPSSAHVGSQYRWSVTTPGGTASSFGYFRVTG
jgi:hypothetical protein